jgi:anti-sigma factor RsiW
MTALHVTPVELELYVLGGLGPADSERLEAHCGGCRACAVALMSEARLELAFEQVAKRSIRSRMLRPVRTAGYAAAGLLAMAAAVVLWVGRAPLPATAAGEGMGTASQHPAADAEILDARNDALDGG